MGLYKQFMSMSIRVKILGGLTVMLIVMLALIAMTYSTSSRKTLEYSGRMLRMISENGARELNLYLEAQKRKFSEWSSDDIYGMAIEFETTRELENHFDALLKNGGEGYLVMMLTDRDGRILESAVEKSVGSKELRNRLNGKTFPELKRLTQQPDRTMIMVKTEIAGNIGVRSNTTYAFKMDTKDTSGAKNGMFVGYLHWGKIQKTVESLSAVLRQNGFANGNVLLVDMMQKNILAHTQAAMIDSAWETPTALEQWLGSTQTRVGKFRVQGEAQFVFSVKMESGTQLALTVPTRDVMTDLHKVLWLTAVVSIIALAAMIALGLLITDSITRPIQKALGLARAISEGDLSKRLRMDQKDEVGRLAEALDVMADGLERKSKLANEIASNNLSRDVEILSERDTLGQALQTMVENLNNMVSGMQLLSRQVDTDSNQVAQSSQVLSQGASSQAASLEQITSSITQISGQTQTNAENANQANQLAVAARDASQEGVRKMEDMLKAMKGINESSKEIVIITKAIDEIAFQTNLLALNAAVEAARAGKHGRGFAVVAEEVRTLAARSAKAAKETSELIEGTVKRIESGSEYARETSDALEAITGSIAKVADLVGEITAASKEQSQGISQINQGLNQIDSVTQRNTASSEETAAAAQTLSSQATQLQKMLDVFKLRDTSGFSPDPQEMAGVFGKQTEMVARGGWGGM